LAERSDVDVLSLVHDDEEASHVADLAPMTTSVTIVRVPRTLNLIRSALLLPTSRPTTHTMLDSPDLDKTVAMLAGKRPDVVLAYCSGMARCALGPALRDVPMVLDMVDVDSAKWEAMATAGRWPRSWLFAREAHVLRTFEAAAARHAVATTVVTEKERDTMKAIAPEARVEVVPNGVDARRLQPVGAPTGERRVVFCGVMNYQPNEEAVTWFTREVWPLVMAEEPEARFDIVGSSPTATVRQLGESARNVAVTGGVPDVLPYLWRSAVSVAPLLTARGVQNKVLEAAAAGLPVVVTPIVADGLPEAVLTSCRVAGDAALFASAVVELLRQSPQRRREIAASADLQSISWTRSSDALYEILTQAASRS
jgi:sugar transferase (PEP-CTERM/EpsH1 system associated)